MNKPKIIIDGQEEVELPIEPLQVVVVDSGIKVDTPDFEPLNLTVALQCVAELKEEHWKKISESDLFRVLWYEFYEYTPQATDIPYALEALQAAPEMDRFLVGFVILMCEGHFEKRSQAFLLPDTVIKAETEHKLIAVINLCRGLQGGYDHLLDADINYALARAQEKDNKLSVHEDMRLKKQAIERIEARIKRNLLPFQQPVEQPPALESPVEQQA